MSALCLAMEPKGGVVADAPRQTVFVARAISKINQMGEVQVHALRAVDLDIYRGEFVVLLGPPRRSLRATAASMSALCSSSIT